MNTANFLFYRSNDVISFKKRPARGQHHFCSEASTLFGPLGNGRYLPHSINLTVAATGNTRTFYLSHTEMDYHGEDIAGWVYVTNDEGSRMTWLILND